MYRPTERSSYRSGILPTFFRDNYSKLTVKQKRIIIDYGLNLSELSALDDSTVLEHIDRQVTEELPAPKFLLSEFFLDAFTPPADDKIENYLNVEKKALAEMRQYAESSDIPWITVPVEDYSRLALSEELAKVTKNVNCALTPTFEVDFDTSEELVRTGEFYLSKFGRWCPVRLHEEPDNSVQQFYNDWQNGSVRPVVYRKYVYYLSGPKNRDKFMKDPLKYSRIEPFSALYREPPSNIDLYYYL